MSKHTTNQEPAGLETESEARESIASIKSIEKTYYKPDGSVLVTALDDVDLEIPRGQYLSIMGASGSGKSTLMNILGCLDTPTSGSYELDGINVAGLDDVSLSRVRGQKIGFVFQAFNLISELDIVENVSVPLLYQGIARQERRDRALQALEEVGLSDRLGHRPRELSGGQQQRVAVARALVTQPAIILADEPTGNLDSKTEATLLNLFDELHQDGMTLIIVTHEQALANRSERTVSLRDGEIEYDIKNQSGQN
jgi:putative ABC transport system ATP-binding protein